jgi:hypothetical protein
VSAKKDFQGRARQGEAQRAERDLPGMANPRLSARRRIAVAQKAAPAAYRGSAQRAERDLPGMANPRLSARSRTAGAQKVLAAALEILFLRSRLRTS